MSKLSLKTLFHVINVKTSYNVLLKKPKLHKNMVIIVRGNCLLVVETWERINQLFGHSKQHTHNSAK